MDTTQVKVKVKKRQKHQPGQAPKSVEEEDDADLGLPPLPPTKEDIKIWKRSKETEEIYAVIDEIKQQIKEEEEKEKEEKLKLAGKNCKTKGRFRIRTNKWLQHTHEDINGFEKQDEKDDCGEDIKSSKEEELNESEEAADESDQEETSEDDSCDTLVNSFGGDNGWWMRNNADEEKVAAVAEVVDNDTNSWEYKDNDKWKSILLEDEKQKMIETAEMTEMDNKILTQNDIHEIYDYDEDYWRTKKQMHEDYINKPYEEPIESRLARNFATSIRKGFRMFWRSVKLPWSPSKSKTSKKMTDEVKVLTKPLTKPSETGAKPKAKRQDTSGLAQAESKSKRSKDDFDAIGEKSKGEGNGKGEKEKSSKSKQEPEDMFATCILCIDDDDNAPEELIALSNHETEKIAFRHSKSEDGQMWLCSPHYSDEIKFYSLRAKTCCNPFQMPKHTPKTSRLTVPVSLAKDIKAHTTASVMPDQKLCLSCHIKIKRQIDSNKEIPEPEIYLNEEDNYDAEHEFIPSGSNMDTEPQSSNPSGTSTSQDLMSSSSHSSFSSQQIKQKDNLDKVNAALENLELSPIKTYMPARSKAYLPQKLNQVKSGICQRLQLEVPEENDEVSEIVNNMKKILPAVTNDTKRALIKVLPESWSAHKIKEKLGTRWQLNEQMKTGNIPDPKIRDTKYTEDDRQRIVQFYLRMDVSRELTGTKNVKKIKNSEGEIETRQKKLLLMTLKEAFAYYSEINPEHKVGFTTFYKLKPDEIVFAGKSDCHNICVCIIHQQPKLMVQSSILGQNDEFKCFMPPDVAGNLKSKHLVQKMICQIPTPDCFMSECQDCELFADYLEADLIDKFEELNISEISYKMWTTTDRCDIENASSDIHTFTKLLMGELKKLKTHDFVRYASVYIAKYGVSIYILLDLILIIFSKEQQKFFENIRDDMPENTSLAIGDFSENYRYALFYYIE